MVKFKVLKYNEFSLVHLGMFSKRVEEKPPSFFQLFRIWPSLAISGTFCILGSMYAYQHSSQFTLALRTWNLTSGAAQALCAFICFGLNSTKIQAVHQKLQDLVDKTAPEGNENGIACASTLYWETELKCRRLTMGFVKYGCFQVGSFLPVLIIAILDIFNGEFDGPAYDFPLNMAVPFSLESISVWLLIWCFQIGEGFSYTMETVIPTTCFVSCCSYIVARCQHVSLMMDSIRLISRQIRTETNTQMHHQMWLNARATFKWAINTHVDIYEIFQLVADINSGVIFFLLPFQILYLSLSMYTMENSEFDLSVLGMDIVAFCCAVLGPSFFCHFGNLATDHVSGIGDSAFALNWYEYPIELQKYVILIMVQAKEPVEFSGFGLVTCSVEMLGKLFKSSCSYYIVFRGLSQR